MYTSATSVNISAKKAPSLIPFCFNSNTEANKALSALKKEFPDFESSYTIGKTLFIKKHRSALINYSVEDFVRNLGGRYSNEETSHLADEEN
ncbi:MAG: hypothetical protein IKN09_01770 [Clostridia bacterium]|nr:hypothetical protein [Clostridia bacterium]MBR4261113.1 hypothetical protein [Clostridia bacterium]